MIGFKGLTFVNVGRKYLRRGMFEGEMDGDVRVYFYGGEEIGDEWLSLRVGLNDAALQIR